MTISWIIVLCDRHIKKPSTRKDQNRPNREKKTSHDFGSQQDIPNHDWGLQHFITFQQDIQHHSTIARTFFGGSEMADPGRSGQIPKSKNQLVMRRLFIL